MTKQLKKIQTPGDILENLFGTIEETRVVGYYYYVFTIRARTSKNYDILMKVGTEEDLYSIYRYSPSDYWESQWGSQITIVSISFAANGNEPGEKIDLDAIESVLKPLKVKFEPDADLNEYCASDSRFGNDSTFGRITDVEIEEYHKYCFGLIIKTDKGFEIRLTTKFDGDYDITDVLNLTWWSLDEITYKFDSITHADKSTSELDTLLQELEDRFIAKEAEDDA